jgi:hypothetical protein
MYLIIEFTCLFSTFFCTAKRIGLAFVRMSGISETRALDQWLSKIHFPPLSMRSDGK